MANTHAVYYINRMRFDVHYVGNQEVQIVVGMQATTHGKIDARLGLVGTGLTAEVVHELNRRMFPDQF